MVYRRARAQILAKATGMKAKPSAANVWDQVQERLNALAKPAESLSQAALAEKLARRAEALREQLHSAAPTGPTLACLSFSLTTQHYALPLEDVLEVRALEQFTPVPGVPTFIRGAVQCRGTILAMLDVGRLFGVAEAGLADVHYYVVAENSGRRVALAAGVAEDIIAIPHSQLRPAPALVADVPSEWIRAVFDENRIVLDLARLLQHERLVNWQR